MILRTNRLWIRTIDDGDLLQIHELLSATEVAKFDTLGIPKNILFTKRIVAGWLTKSDTDRTTSFTFKIDTKDKREFIGLICIKNFNCKFNKGEVWYKLAKEFWGNGYATEALEKILEFGFNDLQLHRIEAECSVENIGSFRVMEKAGMVREGRKRRSLPLKTGWVDSYFYAILKEDWEF